MKKLIGANFKMNKSNLELRNYLETFTKEYPGYQNIDVFIAPMTASLGVASGFIPNHHIGLGAQNMHFEESGAYTGEASPSILAEFWCSYGIVGHSERRTYFQESNELINKKVRAAISHAIRPVLCVGEDIRTKTLGLTKEFLKIQLAEGLEWIEDVSQVDIAYEPIWAIGSGQSASSDYAEDIHAFIRSLYPKANNRIIYGGSVTENNAKEFMSKEHIQGLLIGGASLDPKRLLTILDTINSI